MAILAALCLAIIVVGAAKGLHSLAHSWAVSRKTPAPVQTIVRIGNQTWVF